MNDILNSKLTEVAEKHLKNELKTYGVQVRIEGISENGIKYSFFDDYDAYGDDGLRLRKVMPVDYALLELATRIDETENRLRKIKESVG